MTLEELEVGGVSPAQAWFHVWARSRVRMGICCPWALYVATSAEIVSWGGTGRYDAQGWF